jgi:hypothetical protein
MKEVKEELERGVLSEYAAGISENEWDSKS